MTDTARQRENITCRGMTTTARHAARFHSFIYISTTQGENGIGLLRACSWSWLSYGVGDSCQKLFLHFFLCSLKFGYSLNDDHCLSCCTLSLIRVYLNDIGSKCNQAASCLFMKELALFRCGRQSLEIISSFFFCSRSLGFLFAVPNFTDGFMRPSNSEMKQETQLEIVTQLSYVALKRCMTSSSHIKGLFVSSPLFRVQISFEAAVRCNDGVKQEVFVGG